MGTQVQVVYPSSPSFSGSGQFDIGPFYVPNVNSFLRCEAHGRANFQSVEVGYPSVTANYLLWAVQWVPHGTVVQNIITQADGPQWFIRQQLGSEVDRETWSPSTDTAASVAMTPTDAWWAGQLYIGESIDVYLSFAAPTNPTIDNFNYFGSLRFWWS